MTFQPLHQQNPQGRFSDRATDYAQYRPTYPAAAIEQILAGLGEPSRLQAADVGAGTGISAALIADRGLQVWAIEPNAAMRAAAPAHPRIQFCDSSAEATGLPDRSVDLVLCCQSFHWFDPARTLPEFHRILKPSGRVALMWNDRDEQDPFTQAHGAIIRAAADEAIYSDRRRKSPDALADSSWFQRYQAYEFQHRQMLDRSGLVGLALSSSYMPKAGEAHDQLIRSLDQLVAQWQDANGQVALAYRVHLYLAEPTSLPSLHE